MPRLGDLYQKNEQNKHVMNITSVVLGPGRGTDASVGSVESSPGGSNVVVRWMVTGSCGDEASDIGSGSGVVPT